MADSKRDIFRKTTVLFFANTLALMCRRETCPLSDHFKCPFDECTVDEPLSIDNCDPSPEQWGVVLGNIFKGKVTIAQTNAIDKAMDRLDSVIGFAKEAKNYLEREEENASAS